MKILAEHHVEALIARFEFRAASEGSTPEEKQLAEWSILCLRELLRLRASAKARVGGGAWPVKSNGLASAVAVSRRIFEFRWRG
jgi:hypothetical protein